MTSESKSMDLMIQPSGDLLTPVASAQAQKFLAEIRTFVAAELKSGVDFGVIPGGKKPSLWKSGAEKLAMPLGLVADFDQETWTIDDPEAIRFTVSVRCRLTHFASGKFAGSRIGTYSGDAFDRWGDRTPEVLKKGPPKFSEIGWIRNKCLSMAQKRAYVAAILAAGRLAADFTSDLEDAPDLVQNQAPPPRRGPGRPPAPRPQPASPPLPPQQDAPWLEEDEGPPSQEELDEANAALAAAREDPPPQRGTSVPVQRPTGGVRGSPRPAPASGQAPAAPAQKGLNVNPPPGWDGVCGICGKEARWVPERFSPRDDRKLLAFGMCLDKSCGGRYNEGRGWEQRT